MFFISIEHGKKEAARKWALHVDLHHDGKQYHEQIALQSLTRLNKPDRLKGRQKNRKLDQAEIKREPVDQTDPSLMPFQVILKLSQIGLGALLKR